MSDESKICAPGGGVFDSAPISNSTWELRDRAILAERTAGQLRAQLAELASVAQEYIDALRDLAVKERTSCGQRLYDARECADDAESGLVKAIAAAEAAAKGAAYSATYCAARESAFTRYANELIHLIESA